MAKHVLLLFQRNWRLIVDGTIILMTTSFLLDDGVGVGFDANYHNHHDHHDAKNVKNVHVMIGIPLKLDVHTKHMHWEKLTQSSIFPNFGTITDIRCTLLYCITKTNEFHESDARLTFSSNFMI